MAKENFDRSKPHLNIGTIGHVDHGKTTLVDKMLYQGQLFAEHQEKGELIMDNNDLERERGITILSKNASITYKDTKINIIDTPGHVDFTAEVERSLRVLDGGVAVFDGSQGVEPQSETVWRQADKYNVPRICFANKMDKTGGDFEMTLKSIHDRLSPNAAAIQFPIGAEADFVGIIDLVKMKAFMFKDDLGKEVEEADNKQAEV